MPAPEDSSKPNPKKPLKVLRKVGQPIVEATSCRFSPTEPSTEKGSEAQPIVAATSCHVSPSDHSAPPRKRSKFLIPGLIIFILLILGAASYLVYQKLSSDRLLRQLAAQGLIPVEGGEFAPEAANRNPQGVGSSRRIRIYPFYLAKTELTQAQWTAVMGDNPSSKLAADLPVVNVNWFGAIEYCNRRSLKEGLEPCYSYAEFGANPDSWPEGWNQEDVNHSKVSCNWLLSGYRLPSEMEWLFAAGGGSKSRYYAYSGSNEVDEVAWHKGNSGGTIHAVGTKAANELGFHDMSGNVWEWLWDIYGEYPHGNSANLYGADSGDSRCGRGGSWNYEAGFCALDKRSNGYPTITSGDLGFRICRTMP